MGLTVFTIVIMLMFRQYVLVSGEPSHQYLKVTSQALGSLTKQHHVDISRYILDYLHYLLSLDYHNS